MTLDRTIILVSEPQFNLAVAVIGKNWEAMASSGHPMAVKLFEHKERRTLEQQALMWIRLEDIATQAWLGGRQFSAEVWHIHFKREFLPDEEGPTKRCRKGYRKWAILPSGEREMIGTTTQLTTFGMAEYMTQLMAYGAGELGVHFSPTPRETLGMNGG